MLTLVYNGGEGGRHRKSAKRERKRGGFNIHSILYNWGGKKKKKC